ncbi:hypothetical protein PVK06_039522 [Gossypium arboreum]|uniref:DUF659 domain-containing protein n=1 Tax=Gossypium arboreum TaxID=29729 RepID=A0ABR0N342_GOSAR|nr:hypothetical protein PVK06_039522 [Gossypium arboreum]
MDPVLERSKSSKQTKLTTSFLKNAKRKLGKVMSKLILHKALPARIVESPFLQPVLQVTAEVGKSVRGPSTYEVTGVYLEEEYKEIQEWVNAFKPIWEERGVTIMCDGRKRTRNQHIINFLIYSPRDNEVAIKVSGKISKQALKEMVTSSEWRRSTYVRKPAGLDMMEVINSSQFWKKVVYILKIEEPLVKVLGMCDGDEKPTMGFIYKAMDRAKLAIQRDCLYNNKYWEIIDRRWSNQLHSDLHSAGDLVVGVGRVTHLDRIMTAVVFASPMAEVFESRKVMGIGRKKSSR